jgi:glycosyltransferase involved in cell wall biosynthesis
MSSGGEVRYVFFVTALAPGGTLSVMREFWARLDRAGRVEVISHGPDRVAVSHPVTVTGGRFGGPLRFPAIWIYAYRTFRAARRAARGKGPTILLPQDSLATGAAVGLAGWMSGTPVLLMEHGTAVAVASDYFWRERIRTPRRRDRLTKPLLRASVHLLHRLSLRTADRVLVAGAESEGRLRELGVHPERIDRYHFPVDLDRFRPADAERRAAARVRWSVDEADVVVASVSRLTPEKGLDLVVDALARLPGAAPTLVLAGDGPEREPLSRRAASAGVPVRFVGGLHDPAEVADLLAAADVFVYAGRQGANTPYAVLEAMAAGLPVVATTEPAVHAAMLAEGRGIAVPPDDVDALSNGLARFAASAQLRSDAGRGARAYVEEHHAPSVLDRELAAIFGIPA